MFSCFKGTEVGLDLMEKHILIGKWLERTIHPSVNSRLIQMVKCFHFF